MSHLTLGAVISNSQMKSMVAGKERLHIYKFVLCIFTGLLIQFWKASE